MDSKDALYTETDMQFIKTGCTLLDEACGGGIPAGKITQIYGDSASGKSAAASEIAANFLAKYSTGVVYWIDAENACDIGYMRQMGIDTSRIVFADDPQIVASVPDASTTVEGFYDLVTTIIIPARMKKQFNSLVIIDSLDALSDRTELAQDIDAGSYSLTKQKKLSEILRRITTDINNNDITLLFISQVRAAIGGFGGKMPAGGSAVSFYCTLRLKLARIKRLKRTVKGIERDYGQETRFTVKKTRYSCPHREIDATFLFAFGVCNFTTNMNFLQTTSTIPLSALLPLGYKDTPVGRNNFCARMRAYSDPKLSDKARDVLDKQACKTWQSIEDSFKPAVPKYKKIG